MLPSITALLRIPTSAWRGPILVKNPWYELPEEAVKRKARPNDGKRKIEHLEE